MSKFSPFLLTVERKATKGNCTMMITANYSDYIVVINILTRRGFEVNKLKGDVELTLEDFTKIYLQFVTAHFHIHPIARPTKKDDVLDYFMVYLPQEYQ
jgi:hypothetical protein